MIGTINEVFHLVAFYFSSVLFLALMLVLNKQQSEYLMKKHISANTDSPAIIYFKMPHSKQWYFISCIFAILNAFILVAFAVISICSCKTPAENPETFFTNDDCFATPTVWNYWSLVFFIAYCTVDGVNCAVIQRDFSSSMLQTYFHHVLGILGASFGLTHGGWMAVTASVSLLTEFSTPFVNLRAILSFLKTTNGPLYNFNGIMMTSSFFVFRCVFQGWLVFYKLVPLIFNPVKSSTLIEQVAFCSYLILVALNWYWFSLMVRGLIKVLLKSKPKTD